MGYLIPVDYDRAIQKVSLQQIISGDMSLVAKAELTAQTEMVSYLRNKYDVTREFTKSVVYNPATIYKANNRVYLDASAYSALSTYSVGTLILINGLVYVCKTAITTAEAFDDSKWNLLGNQYDIYFAQLPYAEFDLSTIYSVDDIVWYKDHTYKAIKDTHVYSHADYVNFYNTSNVPYPNVPPDKQLINDPHWEDLGEYTIPAGSLLNSNFFTFGDNRNQQIVGYMMDIIIYKLYSRILPQSVPENRINNYNIAIGWLLKVAKGEDITADLLEIQPAQGRRIRWGSNVKQINSY